MAPVKSKKSKGEISSDFRKKVKAELRFLQQFPVLDQEGKTEAELARKSERAEQRKMQRNEKGPMITDEDIEAEGKRLRDLRKKHSRESANWAKVKQEAEISYQRWRNTVLTKMTADADIEMFEEVLDQVGLRDSIKKMQSEMHEMATTHTGNGKERNGLGTSSS